MFSVVDPNIERILQAKMPLVLRIFCDARGIALAPPRIDREDPAAPGINQVAFIRKSCFFGQFAMSGVNGGLAILQRPGHRLPKLEGCRTL